VGEEQKESTITCIQIREIGDFTVLSELQNELKYLHLHD
jgi:hypothetical protein